MVIIVVIFEVIVFVVVIGFICVYIGFWLVWWVKFNGLLFGVGLFLCIVVVVVLVVNMICLSKVDEDFESIILGFGVIGFLVGLLVVFGFVFVI